MPSRESPWAGERRRAGRARTGPTLSVPPGGSSTGSVGRSDVDTCSCYGLDRGHDSRSRRRSTRLRSARSRTRADLRRGARQAIAREDRRPRVGAARQRRATIARARAQVAADEEHDMRSLGGTHLHACHAPAVIEHPHAPPAHEGPAVGARARVEIGLGDPGESHGPPRCQRCADTAPRAIPCACARSRPAPARFEPGAAR